MHIWYLLRFVWLVGAYLNTKGPFTLRHWMTIFGLVFGPPALLLFFAVQTAHAASSASSDKWMMASFFYWLALAAVPWATKNKHLMPHEVRRFFVALEHINISFIHRHVHMDTAIFRKIVEDDIIVHIEDYQYAVEKSNAEVVVLQKIEKLALTYVLDTQIARKRPLDYHEKSVVGVYGAALDDLAVNNVITSELAEERKASLSQSIQRFSK